MNKSQSVNKSNQCIDQNSGDNKNLGSALDASVVNEIRLDS